MGRSLLEDEGIFAFGEPRLDASGLVAIQVLGPPRRTRRGSASNNAFEAFPPTSQPDSHDADADFLGSGLPTRVCQELRMYAACARIVNEGCSCLKTTDRTRRDRDRLAAYLERAARRLAR